MKLVPPVNRLCDKIIVHSMCVGALKKEEVWLRMNHHVATTPYQFSSR